MSHEVSHVEVYYIDSRTGWCAMPYDEQGCPVDGARYAYRKQDAVQQAQRFGTDDVRVYRRDGSR